MNRERLRAELVEWGEGLVAWVIFVVALGAGALVLWVGYRILAKIVQWAFS